MAQKNARQGRSADKVSFHDQFVEVAYLAIRLDGEPKALLRVFEFRKRQAGTDPSGSVPFEVRRTTDTHGRIGVFSN